MKNKLFVLLLSLLVLVAFDIGQPHAQTTNQLIRAGMDFFGTFDSFRDEKSSSDVDLAFNFGGELCASLKMLDLGIGIEYQFNRSTQDLTHNHTFSFIPFYGLIRFIPLEPSAQNFAPYVLCRAGFGVYRGNNPYWQLSNLYLKGGLYYGAGVGVILRNKYHLECLYSVNNGSAEWDEYDRTITYSRISLSVGMRVKEL